MVQFSNLLVPNSYISCISLTWSLWSSFQNFRLAVCKVPSDSAKVPRRHSHMAVNQADCWPLSGGALAVPKGSGLLLPCWVGSGHDGVRDTTLLLPRPVVIWHSLSIYFIFKIYLYYIVILIIINKYENSIFSINIFPFLVFMCGMLCVPHMDMATFLHIIYTMIHMYIWTQICFYVLFVCIYTYCLYTHTHTHTYCFMCVPHGFLIYLDIWICVSNYQIALPVWVRAWSLEVLTLEMSLSLSECWYKVLW